MPALKACGVVVAAINCTRSAKSPLEPSVPNPEERREVQFAKPFDCGVPKVFSRPGPATFSNQGCAGRFARHFDTPAQARVASVMLVIAADRSWLDFGSVLS